MKKKITIDTLARITADQFNRVDECFDSVENSLQELKDGQKRILDVLLEIPSKKAFERLETKVQTIDVIDARLSSMERKIK